MKEAEELVEKQRLQRSEAIVPSFARIHEACASVDDERDQRNGFLI